MINGVINVYKEKGFTSHDVVAKLRGILKQKKIGHTGTLDPDAEGVLPICIGKATKLCDMLTDKDKTYEVVMLLGITTDTQDITGEVINKTDVNINEEQLKQVINGYIGDYNQIPPMYSALKVNGKKLYELARAGITIEREPRKVLIHNIIISDINLKENKVRMTVDCSKGTYIRTLCHDIGKDLLCGACMDSLIRTKVAMFHINNSLKLSEIEELINKNQLDNYILKVDKMFSQYSEVSVSNTYNNLIYNGNTFLRKHLINYQDNIEYTDTVRVYDEQGLFIGIYNYSIDEERYKPLKIFI